MALSMDEQRILEEMERNLAADDPRLASRLTAFGQQGMPGPFLSGRVKTISGVLALTLIAAVTLVLFVLSPFARSHYFAPRTTPHHSATPQLSQGTQGTQTSN